MSAKEGMPVFTNFEDFYKWISIKYPGIDKQKLVKLFEEKGINFDNNGKVNLSNFPGKTGTVVLGSKKEDIN